MDILKLIKERRTIRRYQDKPIPQRILNKIIDAGRWGPSLHSFQPWKFMIINNKKIIGNISSVLKKKNKKMYTGYNMIMNSTASTIKNAQVLIIVFNTNIVTKKMGYLGKIYVKCARLSEIEAISAAIQNIMLTAQSCKVGICWTVFPIFCEKYLKKLLGEEGDLIAILTLGIPAEKGRQPSRRSPIIETIKYINER